MCFALGEEGQAGTVGRPSRLGIALRAGGEAVWLSACGLHHPDVGEVLIFVLRERGDDKRHPPPIRRDLRVADEADAGEILRSHRATGGIGHRNPPNGAPRSGTSLDLAFIRVRYPSMPTGVWSKDR